jgi:hypothetical protein
MDPGPWPVALSQQRCPNSKVFVQIRPQKKEVQQIHTWTFFLFRHVWTKTVLNHPCLDATFAHDSVSSPPTRTDKQFKKLLNMNMKIESVYLLLHSALWVNLDPVALGQWPCFGPRPGEGSNGDNVPWVAETRLLQAEYLYIIIWTSIWWYGQVYCYVHYMLSSKKGLNDAIHRVLYPDSTQFTSPRSCAQDVSDHLQRCFRNEIGWSLPGLWPQQQRSSLDQFQNRWPSKESKQLKLEGPWQWARRWWKPAMQDYLGPRPWTLQWKGKTSWKQEKNKKCLKHALRKASVWYLTCSGFRKNINRMKLIGSWYD